MTPVIFWGATGQAKVLADVLPAHDAELIALFDNRALPSPCAGVPIFCGEAGFDHWKAAQSQMPAISACVAIGGARGRDRLERMLWLQEHGHAPLTIIHPNAFLAASAQTGDGCQLLAMSAVCASAKLGRAVIVNTKASIDHDCHIADGVHIAPGATLAGEVIVDEFAFIGTGAVVLPRVRIGAGAIVGAGTIVTRDVAAGVTVVGNPAHPYYKKPA